LEQGSDRVSLQKWLPRTVTWTNRPSFAWQELQAGRLRQPFVPGTSLPVQVISNGPYLEVSLGGEVVLVTLSGGAPEGRVGCGRNPGWFPSPAQR